MGLPTVAVKKPVLVVMLAVWVTNGLRQQRADDKQSAEAADHRAAGQAWKGEVEAVPGRSMPGLKVVRRDYPNLYRHFISLGPLVLRSETAALFGVAAGERAPFPGLSDGSRTAAEERVPMPRI